MARETVLVIEDDRDIHKILRYNLEKEGYRVLLAGDGEEGFGLARSAKPDVVILDLMLPKMDGLEVCRVLKYDPDTRHIPVLMLTAKGSEVDQVVGLELGASDYMTKPFSVKILAARIRNLIKARRIAPDDRPVVRSGEFLVDRNRQVFELSGKAVALTRIEFMILAALLERPGFVWSREQIVESVWGRGAFVSEAAVNMHIKKLRSKLGKQRGRIETVRGSGYRFGSGDHE